MFVQCKTPKQIRKKEDSLIFSAIFLQKKLDCSFFVHFPNFFYAHWIINYIELSSQLQNMVWSHAHALFTTFLKAGK